MGAAENQQIAIAIEPIMRLDRDIKQAAIHLSSGQARYLVDIYYQWQDQRIRASAQQREASRAEEPSTVVDWARGNFAIMERDVQRALDAYSRATIPGRWLRSIVGIGPVIAAGLLAHIDITRAPTAGHIWRFAGLDPTVTWERKQKRPWNAALKRLSWLAGESFVKVCNRPGAIYGQVYLARKELELANNAAGAYAEQARLLLEAKNIGKDTDAYAAYAAGQLPPAHVHSRAKRYAVKLFLSHFQHVAYEDHYGKPPARPYVIEHLGHADYLAPPNWPLLVEKMGRADGEAAGDGEDLE